MTYEEILQAMTEEFTGLAGFSPDGASDIGIRMKVLAAQLYELWLKTERLQEEMFPQTAQGEYLDMHGETRGILRREAAPSVGTLLSRWGQCVQWGRARSCALRPWKRRC